jgi:uncharacterized protein (DUF58 family)
MSRETPAISVPVAEVAARSDVLRRLELEVRRRIDGIASGDLATLSIGPGSERAGARAYAPGDDARLIDWNLTARSAETFVRQTEADRESETWIVADRSASLDFGTTRCEKRDVVLGATAGFGMLRIGGGNRIGLVLSGTDTLRHRPARQGRAAFMTGLAAVFDTPRMGTAPSERADLGAALRWLQGAARRRGQVVVVSDFLDGERWQRELRLLALRHEVVAVHVTDPRELELPSVGILAVVDAETGRQRYVNSGSRDLREKYAAAAAQRDTAIRTAIHAAGAEYLALSTSRDWLTDTVAFAARRRALRSPAAIQRIAHTSSAASTGAVPTPGLALR